MPSYIPFFFLTLLPLITPQTTILPLTNTIHPECPTKCGKITIPYPFGIGQKCAINPNFIISCNQTTPFLRGNSLPLIDISLSGHLRKYAYVASDCYNNNNNSKSHNRTNKFRHVAAARSVLDEFYYSPTRNRLFSIGCDTDARLAGSSAREAYLSGCISICYNKTSIIDGSCSGIGCCQTAIPKQLHTFNVTLASFTGHKMVMDFNPCSYAFIADLEYYRFSSSDLVRMPDRVPAVLDWAVGENGCEYVKKMNISEFACVEDSVCIDSDNGPGYNCFCSHGFAGNPYLHAGCVDVDECSDGSLNDCIHGCVNLKGNYTCSCPRWFHGDGRRHGQGCTVDRRRIIGVAIGSGVFLILLIIGILIFLTYTRQTMQKRIRSNLFKQNGGLILQEKIFKSNDSINRIRIFLLEEIQKATDNFSEDRICGRGGFGTVYKGYLSDGSVVAIKKSKLVDQCQIEQFINEITVLSQINHRNVVRFLGCCLETSVPLLIYEFITNGTLSDHLHDENRRSRLVWKTRLKIAADSAGVLAYLHSSHHIPIIHRDIKPTNILLDDDYTAKVSDFGASRLIPKNEIEMCTMVQGTLGYLDPEYFRTSQITEKSDVYSFGVVLAELLTGQKAVSFERSENYWNLVNYFVASVNDGSLMEILDKGIVVDENREQVIEVVGIARKCLMVKGDERPSMKEVGMELESLQMSLKRKCGSFRNENSGECSSNAVTEYLGVIGDDSVSVSIDCVR